MELGVIAMPNGKNYKSSLRLGFICWPSSKDSVENRNTLLVLDDTH